MSDACQKLHDIFNAFPRLGAGYDTHNLPINGIYIVFEKGEKSHGGDRIVRIGTHTGSGNLHKRLKEHLYTPNKDRSIFRKHIGRALLAAQQDNFAEQWEIDITKKSERKKHEGRIDLVKLQETENKVTYYIIKNFSFCIIEVQDKMKRLLLETGVLATIALCTECRPSRHWLGLQHPRATIRQIGLWNIQGIGGNAISFPEIEELRLFSK